MTDQPRFVLSVTVIAADGYTHAFLTPAQHPHAVAIQALQLVITAAQQRLEQLQQAKAAEEAKIIEEPPAKRRRNRK